MNSFMQMPDMANIDSISVKAPKESASGMPKASGGDNFATMLEGTMTEKGQLHENMKSLSEGRDILKEAMMSPLGLGIDLELLAGLHINENGGIIPIDEMTPEAASENALTAGEKLADMLQGQIGSVNQTGVISDENVIDQDVSPVIIEQSNAKGETNKPGMQIDLKAVLAKAERNANAIQDISAGHNQNNNVTKNIPVDDTIDNSGKHNISAARLDNNIMTDRRGMSIIAPLESEKIFTADHAAADDVMERVRNSLNVNRVEISKEAPVVKAESVTKSDIESLTTIRNSGMEKGNMADQISEEDTDHHNDKSNGTKTGSGDKVMPAAVSDKASIPNAKAELSDNAAESQTIKGINAESLSQDNARIDTSRAAQEPSSVKFVLPEDLSAKNLQSKHTIFIKLEPEHLGTVRLTLSSQGHSIMGRMVVDSTSAQSAVESHINNLLDDLAEKGVRLDAFQVSVGGGQTGRRYMHGNQGLGGSRHYGWSREMGKYENEPAGIIGASRGSQYIGRSGVNWLA
ncbi:MAG: hypothetical protein CVT49_03635 [candidate division Zixibacteria bacterium HGW-Zixibacteria-1]|nr:MAG: hypothetical protein CVT49_03635 [candidate division Zixibacteria bacterium HGW-Zixibacteria-1]